MLLGIVSGLLILSIAVNIIAYRYTKHIINKLKQFTENVSELKNLLNLYSQHLQITYEAPTFYGDSTLENLLKHTKEIISDIKDFSNSFLIEPPEDKEGK